MVRNGLTPSIPNDQVLDHQQPAHLAPYKEDSSERRNAFGGYLPHSDLPAGFENRKDQEGGDRGAALYNEPRSNGR